MSESGQDNGPSLGLRMVAVGAAASIALTACTSETSEPDHRLTKSEASRIVEATEQTWTLDLADAPDTDVLDVSTIKRHVLAQGETVKDKYRYSSIPLFTVKVTKGGVIATDITPGIERTDIAAIETALATNQTWMYAAAQGMTLDEINFSVQEKYKDSYQKDGTMQYVPARTTKRKTKPSSIEYELPSGDVPTEVIETMLHHELTHALDERLALSPQMKGEFMRDASVPVEKEAYARLCAAIRTPSINAAGMAGKASLTAMRNLSQEIPAFVPGMAEPLEQVYDAMRSGRFGEIQPHTGDYGMSEDFIAECYVVSPWNVARNIYGGAVRYSKALDKVVMRNSDAIEGGWFNAMNRQPAYRALREDTYLDGEVAGNSLGHPTDGTLEITTSLLNIATLYPEELRANLATVAPDQRRAIEGLLRKIARDTLRAHPDQPDLKQVIETHVAKVLG